MNPRIKALLEGLKSFARFVIFTGVGAALAAAGAAVSLLPEPWEQAAATAIIAALLTGWDKYIHKSESKANGLVGF